MRELLKLGGLLLIAVPNVKIYLIQLPPIMAASGYLKRKRNLAKSLWYQLVCGLFCLSAQKLNLGNIFMIVKKK